MPANVTANTADDEGSPANGPADAKTGKLGSLAAVIRRRTLDFVAIAILLGAGLTFGTQVTGWWNRDAEDLVFQPSERSTWQWNDPNHPVEIVFGDADFALEREIHHGTTESAVDRLLDRTLQLATTAPKPGRERFVEDGELVRSALAIEPTRTSPDDRCSVHLSLLPLPTAVGLRREPLPGDDAGRPWVVCWGILLGGGDDVWTVYWFVPREKSNGPNGLPSLVPPPGSRTTMRILDGSGSGLWGLRGEGTADEWRRHFDSRFPNSVSRSRGWTNVGGVWTAGFTSEADGWNVDVRFEERGGVCDGIVEIHRREH